MKLIIFYLTFKLLNSLILANTYFKFTNLKCEVFDEPFVTIPVCKLKMVQRGVVAMDMHVKLHRLPVTNVSINSQLLKKANGYRPFLYNVSQDFCLVLKNAKRYPYLSIFLSVVGKHSNINHTCPYNHDIIIKRLVLQNEMFKLLPLPQGDYLFLLKVSAYNDLKTIIKIYISVSDKNSGN